MLIWVLMAIGLVVIFIITFVGRRRYGGRSESSSSHASNSTHATHHGKKARNHRGRGSH